MKLIVHDNDCLGLQKQMQNNLKNSFADTLSKHLTTRKQSEPAHLRQGNVVR